MNILQKINQYVFQSRGQKYLATHERTRRFVSYHKARSVLILFESDLHEKNVSIRNLITHLQQDGKKVAAWGYVDKKEVITSIMPDFRIFHPKQLDFFQCPTADFIRELEGMEFDILLDLTTHPILPLQYLVLHAPALFKAGIHKNDLCLYDFLLDIGNLTQQTESENEQGFEPNELYLYEQIIFYIKSIQTND